MRATSRRREILIRTLQAFGRTALLSAVCTNVELHASLPASPSGAAQAPASEVKAPGFNVAVTLSPKSLTELNARKETIVILAMFSGHVQHSPPYQPFANNDPASLGEMKREILPGQVARFDDIEFEQKLGSGIDARDPQLLINVVSGRKSSQNNLLACGIYEGPLQRVQGKTIPIACRLIDGDDAVR